MTVELHDAETKLAELAESAASGEEVILLRGGRPVARLTAVDEAPLNRRLGGLEHLGFQVPDDFNEMGREEIEKMFYGQQ